MLDKRVVSVGQLFEECLSVFRSRRLRSANLMMDLYVNTATRKEHPYAFMNAMLFQVIDKKLCCSLNYFLTSGSSISQP